MSNKDLNQTTYIEKPWGSELIWAHTQDYVGKILTIQAGQKLSRQYHEIKEETLYVISGNVLLELGPEDNIASYNLSPGDSFHLKPKTIHRMIGITNCVLAEVSTPHLSDVVRLQDEYGR